MSVLLSYNIGVAEKSFIEKLTDLFIIILNMKQFIVTWYTDSQKGKETLEGDTQTSVLLKVLKRLSIDGIRVPSCRVFIKPIK